MLFLVLFLFYSAYFMLRYSVDPGPRRANMSAVYALFGVVLIPVSVPRHPARGGAHPPGRLRREWAPQMARDDRLVSRLPRRDAALAAALYLNELAGKRIDARLRELRERLA